MKDLYEVLYKYTDYGDMEKGRCPAVRILGEYMDWLKFPVCDLGCGRGNIVKIFRELNQIIDGYDLIKTNEYVIQKDITKPMDLKKYKTGICIDILEHVDDDGIAGIFENLKQLDRQVITVSIDKSNDWINGVELHTNIKHFAVWDWIIKENFNIHEMKNINDKQRLYLCGKDED